ncbi:MAG: sugar ABC transporter substrate-binding protein [Oscillospiraceae bacterium]|nr:sugar ABC transporter substrate-binding protein [Oscillospiraceae bacterium]
MSKKILSLLLTGLIGLSTVSCGYPVRKHNVAEEKTVKHYTGFFAVLKDDCSESERIRSAIAKKTGAVCEEKWLTRNDSRDEVISIMINKADYPDFIYAGTDHSKFLEANAYIPLENYIEKNQNLKNYFTEEEWDRIKSPDGHIYIIPCFSKVNMYDTNTIHNDEAFWIQVRVLRWAGYPDIKTPDEYFDLIRRYLRAHPEDENGKKLIGYDILTEGYLYFCLENPPQFLDGYPNDGSCMVDRKTNRVIDYNTTPTAKRWFQKLNTEYHSGIIDPDCFVMTNNQYFSKLSEGIVLGMVDQWWNFGPYVGNLPDECAYVPLGLTIDRGITEHYHSEPAFDTSQGIGVSVSCQDPDGAVAFINDLLDPEIFTLRMWGEEGVDYTAGEDGVFSLADKGAEIPDVTEAVTETLISDGTEEAAAETGAGEEVSDYAYPYFPIYKGMNPDGINAYSPEYQPSEFYNKLSDIMKECFDAYKVHTYVELFNKSEKNAPWYPMWSYTNNFTEDTPYGRAKKNMDEVKHEYLPRVVMSDDFEAAWEEYMQAYKSCNPEFYIAELQNEVTRRMNK